MKVIKALRSQDGHEPNSSLGITSEKYLHQIPDTSEVADQIIDHR